MPITKRILFYILTCLGCSLALPAVTSAGINNGNYMVSFTDYVSPDDSIVLGRTYNSVTQSAGQLGYGWGSWFETYLTVISDGTVIFHLDRTGSQTILHSPHRKLADLKASIRDILEARQKSAQPVQFFTRNADGKKVARSERSLPEHLLTQQAMRYYLWDLYVDEGLLTYAVLPVGSTLMAHSAYGDVSLVRIASGYRVMNGFGVYDFDRQGRLVGYTDHGSLNKGKEDTRFYWGDGKQLLAVSSNKSDTMIFVRHNYQGLITGLFDQQGQLLASYEYNGKNMVHSKDHGDHAYTYHYNEDNQIDAITYTNGSLSIIYDENGKALRTNRKAQ